MRAFNIVPPRFEDGRQEAFSDGLRAIGYKVVEGREATPTSPSDVLVTWNMHLGGTLPSIERFKQAGAYVIVAEEGYTRHLIPKKYFQMALDGNNGSGWWYPKGPERWERLGIELSPWREDGAHVLVCTQRGMGGPLMREPRDFGQRIVNELRKITDREIIWRTHPGKNRAGPTLASQLEGAWACVVWASNCATQALVSGIPVFVSAPHHIMMMSCIPELTSKWLEEPIMRDDWRDIAFEDMAWAQWTPKEISDGTAYRHLLQQDG